MSAKNSETVPTFDGKGNLTGSLPMGGKETPTVSGTPQVQGSQVTQRGEEVTKFYEDLVVKYKRAADYRGTIYGLKGSHVQELIGRVKYLDPMQIINLAAAEASRDIGDEYDKFDPREAAHQRVLKALEDSDPYSTSNMINIMEQISPRLSAYQKELDRATGKPEEDDEKSWLELASRPDGWNPLWDTAKNAEVAITMAILAVSAEDKITPSDYAVLVNAYDIAAGDYPDEPHLSGKDILRARLD
jgi:hypothetical protein